MRIEEIEIGSQVTLEVCRGDHKMEFKTEVIRTIQGCVLTDTVTHNNHVLKFDTQQVKVNLISIDEGGNRLYIWENCVVRNIVNGGRKYHMIASPLDVKATNRREYFRVYAGLPGKARLGNKQEVYDVVVKDVSQKGFALIYHQEIEYDKNPLVVLLVNEESLSVNIMGRIVRREEIDDNHYLYGCRFEEDNPAIQKFVSDRQREELKRTRGTDNTKKPLKK